jgi:hypothetical protein
LEICSGNKPGIQREARAAGNASVRGSRGGIWGKDARERKSYAEDYLISHGFSKAKSFPEAAVFDDDLIGEISEMTPLTPYAWCKPPMEIC